MATHSSVLAWRIPGTGEPGGLLSMESHRVGHDWSELAVSRIDYQSLPRIQLAILMYVWSFGSKVYMTDCAFKRQNSTQSFLRICFLGCNPHFGSNKKRIFFLIINWIFVNIFITVTPYYSFLFCVFIIRLWVPWDQRLYVNKFIIFISRT